MSNNNSCVDCGCKDPHNVRVIASEGKVQDADRSVCEIADNLVTNDRQASYGTPLDNFTQIANLLSAAGYCKRHTVKAGIDQITAEDIPIIMILTKISRELHSTKRDNLIDICGYAKTKDQVHKEREVRSNPHQIGGSLLKGYAVGQAMGVAGIGGSALVGEARQFTTPGPNTRTYTGGAD